MTEGNLHQLVALLHCRSLHKVTVTPPTSFSARTLRSLLPLSHPVFPVAPPAPEIQLSVLKLLFTYHYHPLPVNHLSICHLESFLIPCLPPSLPTPHPGSVLTSHFPLQPTHSPPRPPLPPRLPICLLKVGGRLVSSGGRRPWLRPSSGSLAGHRLPGASVSPIIGPGFRGECLPTPRVACAVILSRQGRAGHPGEREL